MHKRSDRALVVWNELMPDENSIDFRTYVTVILICRRWGRQGQTLWHAVENRRRMSAAIAVYISLTTELCCLVSPRQPAPYSHNYSDMLVLPTFRINAISDRSVRANWLSSRTTSNCYIFFFTALLVLFTAYLYFHCIIVCLFISCGVL